MSIEDWLGRGRIFVPRMRYRDVRPRAVLVLEHGRNPSTDYYIRPRLASFGDVQIRVVDIRTTPPTSVPIIPGTFVVIVRYFTRAWALHLLNAPDELCGVAYFMDDDLPAALFASGLPLRYRYGIFRRFAVRRSALSSVCSDVWVSTPYLAERYGLPPSAVLEPRPLMVDDLSEGGLSYFYAGTASHRNEFIWLSKLVGELQQRTSNLTFVTFGGTRVRRLFEGIPRVLCLHPVSWPTFVASLTRLRLDIGLAPLLAKTFNAGRSYTKFFDHTRLGAVGIYSEAPPYAGFVRHGVDGLLVPNDREAWCSAILELAGAPDVRSRLLAAARRRERQLAAELNVLPWE